MPTAVTSKTVAAMVSPLIRSWPAKIMPAPMKPMPQMICAARREGLGTTKLFIRTSVKPHFEMIKKAPLFVPTTMQFPSAALLWRISRSSPIAAESKNAMPSSMSCLTLCSLISEIGINSGFPISVGIYSKFHDISGAGGSIHPLLAFVTAVEKKSIFLITNLLAKCEVKGLNARIKKLDLESSDLYLALLPDQLIEAGFANFTGAIRRCVSSTINAGGCAVQRHPEANRLAVLRRGHHQVQITAVKPEYNSAPWCLRHSALGIHVPRTAESPVVQTKRCGGTVHSLLVVIQLFRR